MTTRFAWPENRPMDDIRHVLIVVTPYEVIVDYDRRGKPESKADLQSALALADEKADGRPIFVSLQEGAQWPEDLDPLEPYVD